MEQLEIGSFRNPRDFVSARLEFERRRNSNLSLRNFAKRAGFSSPSTLGMFLSGKRKLSLNLAEKLSSALLLRGREKQILIAWAKLEGARNEAERVAAERKLVQLKNNNGTNLLVEHQYRFLTIWYYPVLFTMVGQAGFREDAKLLSDRLGRGVKPEHVQLALKELIALGLLRREGEKLAQTHERLSTPEDLRDISIRRYHINMLNLAREALELPLEEREFNGLTVSVPKKHLPAVKDMIRDFRKQLNLFLSEHAEPGEVYQFGVQLFPLTKQGN